MKNDSTTRSTVHYSGRVQGVGFRYSVLQVAKEFEVTGFVQNLPDGRVLMEAEGSREEVDAFVQAVADRMTGFIRKVDRADEAGARKHQGFGIR